MKLPSQFGRSWAEVLQEWCLGVSPPFTEAEASRGLQALARLWPEYVERMSNEPARGLLVVAPAVDLGEILADCENLEGFRSVFERVKNGERSARAELTFASVLVKLGYQPGLQIPLEGKVLDLSAPIAGNMIYFEVATPEQADAGAESQRLATTLSESLKAEHKPCRLEVEILAPLSPVVIADIRDGCKQVPENSDWIQIGALARIRKTSAGSALPPLFDGDGASIAADGDRDVQSDATTIIVRFETTDARANRIFHDKYHQFSDQVPNALVLNVSAVSEALQTWPDQLQQLLQPQQNRKVGAIILFDQKVNTSHCATQRKWKTLHNPHAHIAFPRECLEHIDSLNVSG